MVCAAIRANDGELLLGIRHYSADMHRQISQRSDGAKFVNRLDDDQGFIDQHGKFLSRQEAYELAFVNGQILHREACGRRFVDDGEPVGVLYSEALY